MSEAKTLANRRNAKKSTGPKTAEGKALVAKNAITHGLTGAVTRLETEDADAFDAFAERMRKALAPVGELEELLADRAISCAWRLRRVVRIEGAILEDEHANAESWLDRFPKDDREPTPAAILARAWDRAADKVGLLNRYEVTLERSMAGALRELERLQGLRPDDGGDVFPPTLLDAGRPAAAESVDAEIEDVPF